MESVCVCVCVCVCSVAQSCLTLCDLMDYSPQGFFVHGILQERKLEWVVIPFSRGSSWPRDWTQISCTAGRFFYRLSHKGNPHGEHCCCSIAKSCLTLWDPMNYTHTGPLCPSLSPWVCSNSCPLSQWCHPTTSSSVAPYSSIIPSIRVFSSESALHLR